MGLAFLLQSCFGGGSSATAAPVTTTPLSAVVVAQAMSKPQATPTVTKTSSQKPTAKPQATRKPAKSATPTATVRAKPTATATPRPKAQATSTKPPSTPTQVGQTGPPGMKVLKLAKLPPEAQHTIALIKKGGPFPYQRDGIEFQNREGILPRKARGYYHEYTVITPGSADRGARRIIAGSKGELYYTDDHYNSFSWVDES